MKCRHTVVAGLLVAGVVLGGAASASADPTDPLTGDADFRAVNGFGSATTQDLYNALATVVTDEQGSLALGSFDAEIPAGGSADVQTRPGGPLIPRPNGSEEGTAALRAAADGTFLSNERGISEGPLSLWDVQYARASTEPSWVPQGWLAYVPLAFDAVTYAVHDGNGTAPPGLTWSDLQVIYVAHDGESVDLSSGVYTVGRVGTGADIVPFLPQPGSDLRLAWLSALGLTEWSVGTAVADEYDDRPVVENDGSVLVAVPGAMVPFSVAQYVAQGRSALLEARYGVPVPDRRHGAVLGGVDGIGPLTAGERNPEFPLQEPIFTVVLDSRVDSDQSLQQLFVDDPSTSATEGAVYDATSLTGSFVIEDFGFGSLIDRATGANGVEFHGDIYSAGDAENFRSY